MGCFLACRCAFAAEAMEEFAYALPIEGTGDEAFYRLVIPNAVYEGTAFADLRDVRVFNGDGEVVPHAFLPVAEERVKRAEVALPFFTLRGPSGTQAADLDIALDARNGNVSLRVKSESGHSAQTEVVGYLIDLSSQTEALSSLVLDWEITPEGYVSSIDVQASNDLKNWSTIVHNAPLVHLSQAGLLLEQKTVALRDVRWKYLRLNWHNSSDVFKLRQVSGQFADQAATPVRSWKDIVAAQGSEVGEYVADTGGRFAVDRLRLHLPQDNAVAPLEIYARRDPHRQWNRVSRTVVYRLRQDGQVIESPEISLAPRAHRYWLLKVDQRSGGIGAGDIRMEAGWLEREMAFAARGPGPFHLAFGNGRVASSALSMDMLMPHRRGKSVSEIRLINTGAVQTLAGAAAAEPRLDRKKLGLWIALLSGVVILAFMAWRLSRQLNANGG